MAADTTFQIAVLGAGRMGAIHAHNICRASDARVAVVSDVDTVAGKRLAQSVDADYSADPIKAIERGGLSAVVVASPENLHGDQVLAALRRGVPVFCEKPLDTSLSQVDRVVEESATTGVPVFVGYNRRFDASRWALHQALAEGVIGPIEMVHITSRDTIETLPYVFTGGMFRNSMGHDMDMVRWILGEEPVEVFAYGTCLIDPIIGAMDDVDTAIVTMRTASGALVQINSTRRANHGYDQRIEVMGGKGMLEVGNQRNTTVALSNAEGTVLSPIVLSFMERYAESYVREMDAFLNMLRRGDAKPACSALDGQRALLLSFLTLESWKTGVPVTVDYSRRDFDHLNHVGIPKVA